MYTLLELESKTFGELKKIGQELNVLPEGDRRYRQSWIDALVNVNPPLLALLETSPTEDVQAQKLPIIETVEASPALDDVQAQEPPIESKFGCIVYPRPAQKAIVQSVETSPGVEVGQAQKPFIETVKASPVGEVEPVQGAITIQVLEPISQVAKTSPGVEIDPVLEPMSQVAKTSPASEVEPAQGAIEQAAENPPGFYAVELTQEPLAESTPGATDCPFCGATHALFTDRDYWIYPMIRCVHCAYSRPKNYPGAIQTLAQESKSGLAFYPCPVQPPIAPAAKNTPSVDPVERPECVECFDDGFIEYESGFIRLCQSCNEPKLSHQRTQIAIAPAAKNLPGSQKSSIAHKLLELFKSSAQILEDSPGVNTEATAPATQKDIEEEPDQNPILTGIVLSDRFVARYSPPQIEIVHFKPDADGQLSLLDFEIESVDEEPPDPDDFDCMFAFWAAYDAWDAKTEASDDDSEPLKISLDSFCEWAPCPDEWYEPVAELESSKVMELSPVHKNSSTSDFFIPTFNGLSDRSNGSDEPPDTGIFARLPKPKPPTFPPQASQPKSGQVSPSQPKSAQVSPSQPGIPKLLHCVVAGTSNQPARSPPGGDAM
jgi:hypothetical protein